jgi:hypothetical protein
MEGMASHPVKYRKIAGIFTLLFLSLKDSF